MASIQKIIPNLWFDRRAEEAVQFYISVFKNSKIGRISRYGPEGYEIHGIPEGTVMTIEFQIEGQQFVALNGGPHFKFSDAISFIIRCDNQQEIDYYWETLSEGGDETAQICGWLKDQYGVSWQIIPASLTDLLQDQNSVKSQRVMRALLQMKKLEIEKLEAAFHEG